MKTNTPPKKGLAVLSSYNIKTRRGEFWVINIEDGHLVAHREFRNAITSDNLIALLGMCKACQFCIDNNYIEVAYCSNTTTYEWVNNKRVKTKVSSPGMIKLALKEMKILHLHDFSESIGLWNPGWGNMRAYLNFLSNERDPIDDLPF